MKIDYVDSLRDVNSCPCIEGFSWSKVLQRCRPFLASGRSIKSYIDENEVSQLNEPYTPRLLQACDGALGFITYGNACLNCRLLPFTLGVALSSTSCACAPSFSWVSNTCYCGYLSYIDAKTKKCEPCSSLPSTSLLNQCRSCSIAFVQGVNGCVYYPTLENNGGEFGYCALGYRFDPIVSECICDFSKDYAIKPNRECSVCENDNYDCKSCSKSYISNNF